MGPPKCGAPGNCPICPPLKPALTILIAWQYLYLPCNHFYYITFENIITDLFILYKYSRLIWHMNIIVYIYIYIYILFGIK